MRWTRRRFLASLGAAGVCGAAADAFWVEPQRVTISRHAIGPGATNDGAAHAAAKTPPRRAATIVQLTDLHMRENDPHAALIAEETIRLNPDLIVITGDSIDNSDRLPELGSFLDLLPAATPKLAILGNWEHRCRVPLDRLYSVYEQRGCQLLVNEAVVQNLGDLKLVVSGVDDLVGGAPELARALSQVKPAAGHLLLAHCPAYRDLVPAALARHWDGYDASSFGVDCVLSGHTHGGQITLAGLPLFTPHGSGRYVSGWYRDCGLPNLYVSRGLGTTAIAARFCAPPEIAVFDWMLPAS